MTVKDLIARLMALEPDLPVVAPGESLDFEEVGSAFVDLMVFKDGELQLTDEREGDGVRVVRLFGVQGA